MYVKALMRAILNRLTEYGIDAYRPYPKHKKFHEADKLFRMLYGSNSSGKTYAGVAECCMHASGIYPKWFPDYNRYPEPISVWMCLWKYDKFWDTHWQYIKEFIGPIISRKNQKNNEIHLKNGSVIRVMSYRSGRDAFESSAVPFIYLDEEPTEDILDACFARIVRVPLGQIISTITPIQDPQWFHKILEKAKKNDDYYVDQVTMDDNLSLSEQQKKEFAEGIDNEREYMVRIEGEPVPLMGRKVFKQKQLDQLEEDIEEPSICRLEWDDDNYSLERVQG